VPFNAVYVSAGSAGVRIIDVRTADTGGIKTSGHATLIERCHIVDSHGSGVDMGGSENVLKDCHIKNVSHNIYNEAGSGVYASTSSRVTGNYIGRTAMASFAPVLASSWKITRSLMPI
jgi:hypothetical protein